MMPLSESMLVLMGLLALAMIAAPLSRYLPIPFTVFLVGIGIGFGELSEFYPPLHMMQHFQLTPDLVLFVFLPALIFESGYNLDARQLIKDVVPVLVLAVPALLLATTIVGLGLHFILGMPILLALLFGALISATDPVAVIALFRELGAPLRLTVLVEGESLFNDATAIVLVNILLGIAIAGGIDASGVFGAGIEFLYVFFGGAALGLVLGLFFSEWMRFLSGNQNGILVLSVILAYVSFIFAEHFMHVSGVMAVVGASLCLGIYGIKRFPHHIGEYLRESWDFLAYICNALLFLLVGLSIHLQSLYDHFLYILLAIALVLLSRLPAVYLLLPMTLRAFHLPKVKKGDQHIMWWGGLKGGLAIAIVLSLPADFEGRQLLLDMTLGVVMFTLLLNAPTIKPIMNRLGLNDLTDDERAELSQGVLHVEVHARNTLKGMKKANFMSPASLQHAKKLIARTMEQNETSISEKQQLRYAGQVAMRAELETLDHLHDAGLVPQYLLVDIKNDLRLEQERKEGEELAENPILKIEQRILSGLRTHDWMSTLLARYQKLRLSGQLQRTFIRILMSDAALAHLAERKDIEHEARETICRKYQDLLKDLQGQVTEVRLQFPEFFTHFETRLAMQIGLESARWQAYNDFKHGETGTKSYNRILSFISKAKGEIPDKDDVLLTLSAKDLIRVVPLFADISEGAAEVLASHAVVVTFLPGDTVIEEGEKGDALYILSSGLVDVSHVGEGEESRILAELRAGDFFGEMALLGNQVRSATVVAKQPSALLRITRKDVLDVASQHQEIHQLLKEAEEKRKQELDSASPS